MTSASSLAPCAQEELLQRQREIQAQAEAQALQQAHALAAHQQRSSLVQQMLEDALAGVQAAGAESGTSAAPGQAAGGDGKGREGFVLGKQGKWAKGKLVRLPKGMCAAWALVGHIETPFWTGLDLAYFALPYGAGQVGHMEAPYRIGLVQNMEATCRIG